MSKIVFCITVLFAIGSHTGLVPFPFPDVLWALVVLSFFTTFVNDVDLRYLVVEKEAPNQLSLGRIAFWIAMGLSIYYWTHTDKVYPTGLSELLWATLLYNIGKKGVTAFKDKGMIHMSEESFKAAGKRKKRECEPDLSGRSPEGGDTL